MASKLSEYIFYFQDCDAPGKPKTQLKRDVDGWRNYGVCFGRETGISNVVKSYTNSWMFIKEDASYIIGKFVVYGPNRRIRLIVTHLVSPDTEIYETEYSGHLDLTQMVVEGEKVSVPVSESGLFKALENRWSEQYSFQLDSICNVTGASFSEETSFSNDGNLESQQCGRYAWVGYVLLGGSVHESEGVSGDFFKDTDIRYLNAHIGLSTNAFFDTNYRDVIDDEVTENDAFFVMRSNRIQRLHLSFNVRFSLTAVQMYAYAAKHRCKYDLYLVSTDLSNVEDGAGVSLRNGDNANADFIRLQHVIEVRNLVNGWGGNIYGVHFEGDYDLTDYDCQGGKVFFLMARMYWGDPSAREMWGDSTPDDWDARYAAYVDAEHTAVSLTYRKFELSCAFASQLVVNKPISTIPAARLFRQLLERIGDRYEMDVDLAAFENVAKDDLLTSGSGLRGVKEYDGHRFPQGHMETSLDKFLKYCMAVYNYRLGVDFDRTSERYRIYLAHHDKFYGSTRIARMDTVANLKISVDRSKLYTSIRCGYDTGDEAINGLSEYNCMYHWLTPNTEMEGNELDLSSPYSASTRTIETYIYKNYSNKEDSDEKDGKVFLIGATFIAKEHVEIPDYSQLPLIDVLQQRWDDVIIVNMNPGTNGEHEWEGFEWYREELEGSPFDTEHSLVYGVDLSAGHRYFCVLTDNYGERYLSMYPFNPGFVAEPPMEVPITDVEQYELRRDVIATEGVVFHQYAWNLDFTPKRMLLSHRKELNSYLAFEVGKRIVMNTCERNDTLVADGVVEKEDVMITDERCFMPMLMEVDMPVGSGLVNKIEENRLGYFQFEYGENTYKGYISEGSDAITINPMNVKAGTLKLLAAKDTVIQ